MINNGWLFREETFRYYEAYKIPGKSFYGNFKINILIPGIAENYLFIINFESELKNLIGNKLEKNKNKINYVYNHRWKMKLLDIQNFKKTLLEM